MLTLELDMYQACALGALVLSLIHICIKTFSPDPIKNIVKSAERWYNKIKNCGSKRGKGCGVYE